MIGAEAILKVLRAMGVERIFASPGSDWAPLWEALARPHAPGEIPEYVSVRHEETAVAMASGYARASGKLPAVLLHTTVGTLHAAMALRIALHERVPMVVMAGESTTFSEPPGPKVGRQWLRLLTDVGGPARLAEPSVKWSFGLNAGALLPQTVQRACQLATSAPRGPVFVSVPIEYLMETLAHPLPAPSSLPAAPAADPAAARRARARALRRATPAHRHRGSRPRAGDGARSGGARRKARRAGGGGLAAVLPQFPAQPSAVRRRGAARSHALVNGADAVLLADCVLPWHPPSALKPAKVFALGEDPLRSKLPYWGFKTDLVVPGESAHEPRSARLAHRQAEPGLGLSEARADGGGFGRHDEQLDRHAPECSAAQGRDRGERDHHPSPRAPAAPHAPGTRRLLRVELRRARHGTVGCARREARAARAGR